MTRIPIIGPWGLHLPVLQGKPLMEGKEENNALRLLINSHVIDSQTQEAQRANNLNYQQYRYLFTHSLKEIITGGILGWAYQNYDHSKEKGRKRRLRNFWEKNGGDLVYIHHDFA